MPDNAAASCPGCARPLPPGAAYCVHCGRSFGPRGDDDRDATGGIIPYKNASALIAYYCGVFSVAPCFPIGLAGVVLGIKGLRYAKQHPASKGQVHAWIGIVIGGIFGALWLVLTGMAAFALLTN